MELVPKAEFSIVTRANNLFGQFLYEHSRGQDRLRLLFEMDRELIIHGKGPGFVVSPSIYALTSREDILQSWTNWKMQVTQSPELVELSYDSQ